MNHTHNANSQREPGHVFQWHRNSEKNEIRDAVEQGSQPEPVDETVFEIHCFWMLREGRQTVGYYKLLLTKESGNLSLMFAGRKLMLAVSILHGRGFEKLRIHAGMAPSGCYWRYQLKVNDSLLFGPRGSLSDQKCFDWGDAPEFTPEELADLMEEKFSDLLEDAKGTDSPYVEWFKTIVKESEPDGLFIEFWDSYDGPCDHVRLINCASKEKYPQPPE